MVYIFHISNKKLCYLETENNFQTKVMKASKSYSVFLKVGGSTQVLSQC